MWSQKITEIEEMRESIGRQLITYIVELFQKINVRGEQQRSPRLFPLVHTEK